MIFFFKQKTAYEIGLGIPAEPLFRSELSRQMTTSTTSIDIMGLQAAYANLHTDQERDYFMQRYHDVISSFGGKTSYDADNRPLLVVRSNLWASGYDVDGTDQTSLGQFSGRVQQTYKHSVPRFFVPEHGTMFTLALVRFPPTATKEIQYLNAKGALTYTDIAGDPVLYGNLPPREISMKDVFRSGDSSKKFKIVEGQWYRYAPSYVSPAYHLLEGFHSFRNRLLVICKNAYLFATMIMTSVSSPFSCCSGIVRLNLMRSEERRVGKECRSGWCWYE